MKNLSYIRAMGTVKSDAKRRRQAVTTLMLIPSFMASLQMMLTAAYAICTNTIRMYAFNLRTIFLFMNMVSKQTKVQCVFLNYMTNKTYFFMVSELPWFLQTGEPLWFCKCYIKFQLSFSMPLARHTRVDPHTINHYIKSYHILMCSDPLPSMVYPYYLC